MRNLVSRWCTVALLLVPLVTSTAYAQTFTGAVRGVVSDANGVIPGVTVTAENATNCAAEKAASARSVTPQRGQVANTGTDHSPPGAASCDGWQRRAASFLSVPTRGSRTRRG